MAKTAAALIIGNEILTGKVEEKNLAFLARELFKLGVAVHKAVVCRDEVDVIISELNALRRCHDAVFTSGGVGPTHDDVTLQAVAKAFNRQLVRVPELEALIRDYHKERTTEEHLRMADAPAGSRLIASSDMPWPTVAIENVFVLPGIPDIFRMKFAALRGQFAGSESFVTRAAYTLCDEGEIAGELALVAERHPTLFIGSYPRFRGSDYKLKLTVDGKDADEVERALAEIVAALPQGMLLRTE